MPLFRCLSLIIAFVIAIPTAQAQSSREQAVAIDRVPLQPPDMMEAERIGPVLNSPWSIVFLPDGRMLVTEKHGGIRIITPRGAASGPLPGSTAPSWRWASASTSWSTNSGRTP